MNKLLLQVLVILLLTISISAQENQPKLIDEFGSVYLDEFRMRVTNLALEVKNTPKSKALVRIAGGQKNEFSSPYVWGSFTKSVWKFFIKFPPEDLSIQFCNINKEPLRIKFYAVRENDKIEACDENLTTPKETVLFETAYFNDAVFDVPQIPFNSFENEYPATEYSVGAYSEFGQIVLKKFLKDSPQSKVYVIAYRITNFERDENGKIITKKTSGLDNKSYSRKMIQAVRKELIKNGFSAWQIVALDGGYVNGNERRLEFWFVPKGGEIPKPKPDYFPKKVR